MRLVESLVGLVVLASCPHLLLASSCTATPWKGHNNTAANITISYPYPASFSVPKVMGYVAFDAGHCQSLCCEEPACTAVVWDPEGAVCVLKGKGGNSPGALVANSTADTYVINTRTGAQKPMNITASGCGKKGLAAHLTPARRKVLAKYNAVSWSYDWSTTVPTNEPTIEYLPTAYNALTTYNVSTWPSDGRFKPRYLLGFNGEQSYRTDAEHPGAVLLLLCEC